MHSCLHSQYEMYHGSAEFCFRCSSWLKGDGEREEHCGRHIDTNDVPFRYDPVRIRNAVVCAGHCPVCLWQSPDLSPPKRLKQFLDKAVWKRHVFSCLYRHMAEQEHRSTLRCPDERCCTLLFPSQDDLWHHLQDIHSIPRPDDKLVADLDRKRQASALKHYAVPKFEQWRPDPLKELNDFAGDGSASSILSDENASVFTLEEDSVQTPLSDLSFDSSTGQDRNLGDAEPALRTGSECDQLPIDPMLSPADMEPHSGISTPILEDQYLVHQLLGKWKHRKTVWFYLQWQDGSRSFEPEENVSEELRKDFEQRPFTGFEEGAHVKRVKGQGRNKRYVTVFDGLPDEWALPQEALHPDLVRAVEARCPHLAQKQKQTQARRKRRNKTY